MSKEYWLAPFMAKRGTGGPVKHRFGIVGLQLADGLLSFVFPGWAFLRQGLNVAGSIGTWLMKQPAPGEALVKQADLDVAVNRLNNTLNDHLRVINAINKNFEVIAAADKEKYNYDKQNMVLTAKNEGQNAAAQ